MIPSRTVFNHRKWIYIELAITRAHSGHGPLVYQPPSAYQSRASSNVFPISSLDASEPTDPPSLLFPCLFPNEDPFVGSVIAYLVVAFWSFYIFPVHLSFILLRRICFSASPPGFLLLAANCILLFSVALEYRQWTFFLYIIDRIIGCVFSIIRRELLTVELLIPLIVTLCISFLILVMNISFTNYLLILFCIFYHFIL